MTTDYVIPDCPGDDPGADWREMGWDSHANAALAHVAWCPNHPGYWKDGPAAMWEAFLGQLDPDEPVPLTPTPKAIAFLDQQDRHAAEVAALAGSGGISADEGDDGPGEYEWECTRCGSVFFGTAPGDDTCAPCRDDA